MWSNFQLNMVFTWFFLAPARITKPVFRSKSPHGIPDMDKCSELLTLKSWIRNVEGLPANRVEVFGAKWQKSKDISRNLTLQKFIQQSYVIQKTLHRLKRDLKRDSLKSLLVLLLAGHFRTSGQQRKPSTCRSVVAPYELSIHWIPAMFLPI